jgi:EpsI family protein
MFGERRAGLPRDRRSLHEAITTAPALCSSGRGAPKKRCTTNPKLLSPGSQRFALAPLDIVVGGAFVLALAWFTAPTMATLHTHWSDPVVATYTHGYLILLLVVVIAVQTLRRFPLGRIEPTPYGIGALALCVGLMVAGLASSTQIVAQGVLPLLLFAAAWAVFGWRQSRPLFWASAYLYFAVPAWDVLNEGLRSLTVFVVTSWLRATDIPAYIEGSVVYLPAGTIEIENGCSGLNYLLVGLALAAFQGLFFLRAWRYRLVLGLAGLGLALVANWLRVFVLILVGHFTDMQHYLVTVDHSIFGWVLFVAVYAPAFWLARVLELRDSLAPSAPGAPAPRGPAAATPAISTGWLVAVVALLFGGIWLNERALAVPSAVEAMPVQLPSVPGWRMVGDWQDDARPLFVGALADARWYRSDAGVVGAYFARYPVQSQAHEVVYYANRPQGGSTIVREASAAAGDVPIREMEVADGGGPRRLVWLTMRVAGTPVRFSLEAKVLQAWGVLVGEYDADALVLSAACEGDCESARALLRDYARAAIAHIHQCVWVGTSGEKNDSKSAGWNCHDA